MATLDGPSQPVPDQAGSRVELPASHSPAMSIANSEPCTLLGPQLLHELALAGAHEGNQALEFLAADGNIRCLSYRSLDHLSTKLAAEIARASSDRGPGGKLVVPVLLPQSPELYIAWLGILKAGGAFCPLNIDAPPERIEFILQDVAASVVITQASLAARVPQNEHLAVINADTVETSEVDMAYPIRKSSSTDLAYVMYTSGSTGRPKGVGVSHLAATQSLLAHDTLIPHFTRFLQFASPTFDVSVFEVFFPFMRGATLIGSEREQMLLDISHVMTTMRVDAAELTPTVAGELLRTRAAAPHLRVLLTIGEMLTKHVVEEFGKSETSDGILHGMYGPTEAAIHCTAATHFRASSRVNLIGKPFKTVSAFIMALEPDDKTSPQGLSPLPVGEIGELVVGGPQLADGYINRPEENAKAFIYSPEYGRLYRTGDKAKMLPSGDIECFGRISSGQVKLRGQRIELGEIEHVICRAPDVRSAVAIVSGGSLAAFVLVNDKGITDRELRDICRQWLPRFMVPGEFVLVSQFPQLPSGKIDRKALEADFARHRNTVQTLDQHSFRDETEETIASCVTDVLGKTLPPTESLVAAGLDSLSAIRLASHLLDAGIGLDVAHLLDADCVDGIWHLAQELKSTRPTEDTQTGLHKIRQFVADAGTARIESLGISSRVHEVEPCSHIQQAMILETIRHTRAYCNWIELEFDQSITPTAVDDAFGRLLERNPILRSGFVEIGLKDHSYACFTWKELDECSVQRCDEFEYDVELTSASDLLRPLRIQLKEAPEGLRALVHIHHALYDGWSWQLILREFYHILLGEQPPSKPSYRVVTDFFIEHKLGESAKESSLFWRDQLQGCPVADFPHLQHQTNISPSTQEVTRMLETPIWKLNDVSNTLKVSRQTIFQAAFCYLLSTYLASEDVIFGSVFSGRTLPVKGIETVLGPCIRTLPMRVNLGKMQTINDLLLAIQNMNRKSLEHGSLPLSEIKKASGIDLHLKLFDTAIVWQESIWSDENHGAPFREVSSAEFLEFALMLEFEPRDDHIHAKATYQNSILPREQVQILLEQIDLVASILINAPASPIHEIGQQLSLTALSVCEAESEVPNLPTAVAQLREIAVVDPTRLAIEVLSSNAQPNAFQEVESISYGQLNSRVNRLAHLLTKRGVKQGDLTAAFFNNSIDSYVNRLAVAKIGAGLLPLASQTPAATIHHLLTAANVQYCIIDPSQISGDLMIALSSTSKISALDSLDDSLDDYHDRDALMADDSFCSTKNSPLSHHNLQSHIAAVAASLPTSTGSKLLHSYPQGTPGSIFAALLAWQAGMTLCALQDGYPISSHTEAINAMQITHLLLTPALASRLDPKRIPSVQCLLALGAPLSAKVHREWAGRGLYHGLALPDLTRIFTIGMVESSSSLTSIGRPLGSTSVMVMTGQEDLSPLPQGALGELCFGGNQMGRTVFGLETPGEDQFVGHPRFGCLYRTGEYGRLLSDGTISLLARQSYFNLHGQHLPLWDIDTFLVASALVVDSLSIVLRNPIADQQQVATIWVPSDSARENLSSVAKDLLWELGKALSPSLVPALLVPVDEIPLTASHMIDYTRLRQEVENMDPEKLKLFSLQVNTDSHEELTDVEKIIAGALSTVTGINLQNIRPHTSFYKLGLDSLSAISLSRQLQDCGLDKFPVSTILRHSSVAQLAMAVPVAVNGHSQKPALPETKPVFEEPYLQEVEDEFKIEGIAIQGIYPCTPLQEAMLAAESDAHSSYFNHLLLRVNVHIEALQYAWIQMQQRHEILRTCFNQSNDKRFAYAQVVLERANLPWSSVEISHDMKSAIEEQKSAFECRSPVNGELPYSLTIFTNLTTSHTFLLLSIHHALYDGEGISQLLQEIQMCLAGEQLPQVVPFHRFIQHMVSSTSDASDEFWDRYLSGVSPGLLSAPKKKIPEGPSVSQQIHMNLKEPLDSFKKHCKDLSVTPLNVLHAAWARLLILHTDTSDVCFGNVFSCRTVPLEGADRIVGPCFNTLPMRIRLSSTSTNADVLRVSQKHNNDILPHQLSPLRRIQRRTVRGGSQLFDTLVIFQGSGTELNPQYWELLEDEGNMGFPLICEVVPDERNDLLSICLHFHKSKLTSDVAERLAQTFLTLVEHTIQYPAAQASDKRLLGTEITQLFEKRNLIEASQFSLTGTNASRSWSYQEEALRDILSNFSGVDAEAVLLHTTIFQLGLDSINAVQISAKLRNLGYKISAGDILEAASVENIAALLKTSEKCVTVDEFDFASFQSQHLQPICDQLDISSQAVQSLRPCTPVQNGMLALFLHSRGNAYFNRMTLKSPTPLNKETLKNAWSTVVDCHEMLRTGFVQLHNQQYPFAMVTYHKREGAQEQHLLATLHQPPWRISLESSDQITTMHFSGLHALYDAQSLESIFSDVEAAYKGMSLANPASIPATLGPILIESQRQIETSQNFWQELASEAHPSKFPDLHPTRTENKTLLSASRFASQSIQSLEESCRQLGVTLQAAGQVAWARLLAAYTGEQNVTFGTVLSGRNLSAAAQDAVFPCLVTVPSPLRIEGTNKDLLDRTLKRNAFLTRHQFTPLAQIQRWLGSDEPLFDTLFVYQKFSSRSQNSQTWAVHDEETNIDYPVSIELVPHSTSLELRVSCRSDIVPEEQARILLNQYDKILEQTVCLPDSSSDDNSSLGNSMLSITPAKESPLPTSVSLLHQFVEQSAEKVPDKTAFEFAQNLESQTQSWSYSQLNGDGNRMAHFLQSLGAMPGGMIAVCFDKCPQASIAILGILKAGCAYLAIDPTAPISRKQFILEDSGTRILLCNRSRLSEHEEISGVSVHAVDMPGALVTFPSDQPLLVRDIQPDDTCYCLYTSGTTGTPKGCEITHDNAVQAMLAFQRLFSPHWDEDSRWLQFASFHFDVSVLEQYWSWSVGICVTSCPRDLLFEDLPGTIQKLQITHIDLTPSLAKLVHPDEVPSLCRGVFITGGEALKQEILDAWGEHGVIYNGYGPTEVTIGCTMLPRMRANDKASNIGPQFDNVGSYVFRPGTSTPVVRGGLGELCVSGPLVGKGYLNRAELTRERFQVLPEYDDRIYRTGDLVRILHDGSFQFLGRIDDQVKLRGQRLEIGEINEVIKQSTAELNEVATLVIQHSKQAKDQLVSFVTKLDAAKKPHSVEISFSEDNCLLLSTIKAACHAHLPGYMVPTHIIPLTRFPLSANNKADMKVLKSIYQDLSLADIQKLTSMTVDQTAKSAREEEIVAVLAKFIGTAESAISSWSSIYELGLDSISVITFSRDLREAGFPQAQPSLVMKHPTVAGMALAFQKSETVPSHSLENLHRNAKQAIQAFAHKHSHSLIENIGVVESHVEQIAPCTPLQEGIIYHFLSSSTPLYCSSFTFEVQPSINLDMLRLAWNKTQDQVQMLRARFVPSPDGYAQVILKESLLPWFQFEAGSAKQLETARRAQHSSWASRLDGLSTLSWEAGVIVCPQKTVMCLSIFHALYDGNSLALLLDRVSQNYLDQKAGFEQTPNFLDVLHLGPLCKDPSAEAFWKDHLANCQNRPLPSSGLKDSDPVTEKLQINSTEHLDSLRKSLNVTEQAVLHACWLVTLHQYYSFVPPVGIITSGRTVDVPGITNVIGPLFNTIPSNVQIRGSKSWSEVARRCHEYHVSTIPFQYTALRDITKWLGKSSEESLFDSLFVFQRENPGGESSTGMLWRPLDSEAEHEYPLAFEIVRSGNESLTVTLAAKAHVLSTEAAQSILTCFEKILSEFSENPDHELPYINGVAKETDPSTNGHSMEFPSSVINGDSTNFQFEWSHQACTIQLAIASLAGVDPQSIDEQTSIFEVGLDSIDAIKLSSRLSKSGIKLPVSAIMRHRNVKAMVSQLEVETTQELNGTLALLNQMEVALTTFLTRERLVPQGTSRILPATPIQEAMIAEMTSSEYQHYYNHEILEVEPHVDLQRLQDAWKEVVKAHPILRTSFVEVWDPEIPASYAQIIHDEDTFDIQAVDLNGANVASVIESQRSRASKELFNRPLLTVTTATDGDRRYLVLSITHALYDGWSINLLHQDVSRAYIGELPSRPSPDAILEQIIASSGDRALKFWRAALSSYQPAQFPQSKHTDNSSTAVHRAEKPLLVSFGTAEAFCKRHGITMQALMVSCWSLVLATNIKSLDVVFGLVLSGRNVADSEHVMFPTMNTVAMRVILHGTRLDLVKYVQETLLEMSEHQHFPLRRARPDIGSRRLFDTLFIYQKRPSDDANDGLVPYKSTGGASDVEYPVCAEVEGVGRDLVGRVACRGSVLGEKDTLALLDHLAHVLSSIVNEPTQQTIEFTGDAVSVCGHPVAQQASPKVVNGSSPRVSTTKEWSPTELTIRNVLSVVSGVPEDSIDRETTIFHLGLDSISAIKVAALMKRQSVKLAVSDMLRAGTIEKMAQAANGNHAELTPAEIDRALEQSLDGINVAALLEGYGIDPSRAKVLPATSGQIYFLAMHALNPEVFYPEFHYMASAPLKPHDLESAWSRLVEQIPILRTAFVPTDAQHLSYVQVIFESVDNPVIWRDSGAHQKVSAQATRGFGAIPAALIASQTDRGTALTLRIHHALYDAVSLPSLMERLAQLCQGQSESKPKVHDISQLVAIQHARSPVDGRRQFWQQYLGPIAIHGVDEQRLGKFGAIQQYYRPGLVAHMSCVEEVGKRQSLSVQSIFLAILARVYAQTLPVEDRELVVGLYLANRSHISEGLSELIAPTVNIVPLRLDNKISDTPESLLDAARRIQGEIHEISRVEYCSVSLVEIAEWTGVRISTCVNFLRVPDMDISAVPDDRDQVHLRPLSREELAGFNRRNLDGAHPSNGDTASVVSGPADRQATSMAALGDVFWPTIDVEAAIRNDGLDFGLFASETRLDTIMAETMIEAMRQTMGAVVAEAS
ncbi:hypothetical protein N7512_005737 [Penicillium capsulatum]|nr:hypothetical protein N7512_005737 [Penicillium capsulatum]